MKVDMDVLKKLRDITQAPLKDCKDALVEANGDLDAAQEILKKKGILKAAKKADRETNEGIVKVRKSWDITVWIKLGCETDFVAKSELFHALADKVIDLLVSAGKEFTEISGLDQSFLSDNIDPLLQENVWKIWENIKLLDAFVKKWNSFVYCHPWDKISTVLFYEGAQADEIAKELALQITAMNPTYKSVENVPSDMIENMRHDFRKELEGSNKPQDVIEKIIEGKISKRLEEFVFTEQIYIRDESKKIKHIIPSNFVLHDYIRFSI